MTKYTVHFEGSASLSIDVEADTPEDAVEASWDHMPGELCFQCSSDAVMFRDPSSMNRQWPEEMEAYEITDEDGNTVWTEPTHLDHLVSKNNTLRERVIQLEAQLKRVNDLHEGKEINGVRYCSTCTEYGTAIMPKYPCDTIKALEGED